MDKMKRVFSFLLAFVITLGAFSSFGYVALADEAEEVKPVEEVATEFLDKVPADVKGTDYEKAVRRLVAFGIIEGFPDGTFKPENELTRAEFSKMVVIALGLEDAAKAMENKKTEFGDVYKGHWAQGYINVASSQGLIKGYEDGTFRPSNQVTYAEAVTILVRALGYQDSFLYGKWPANYISKAADLGISGPVDIPNYDNNALRGNVARLLEETLGKETIHVVQYEGTAITYEPSGKLLREEKLNIYSDKGRLVGDMYVDKNLKPNEVKVYKGTDAKTGKEISRIVNMGNAAGDYRQFIGEKVNLFTRADNVLLIENDRDVNAEFDFVTDAFPEREGVTVELAGHNGRYQLADDAYFYVMNNDTYVKYNGKDKIEAKIANSLPGRVGKVVVENGEIVYGEIMSEDLVAEDFLVVKEVKEDAIVGISPTRGDHKISFSDKAKYKEVHVFDQNGKKIEVKDIEAGDVVYAQEQYFNKKDSLFIVAVQGNNVTGELGRTTHDRFEVDGEYENVAIYKEGKNEKVVGRLSLNLLETSEKYDRKDASDLHKEDVIAYRGAGNLVVMLSANDELAGYNHGIVTGIWPKDGEIEISVDLDGKGMERVKFDVQDEDDLYDLMVAYAEGEEVKEETEYLIKGENNSNKVVGDNGKDLVGQPVSFRVSGDKIAKGSLKFVSKNSKYTVKTDGKLVFGPSSFYFTEDGKEDNIKGFKLTSNTKVIEAYGLNADVLENGADMDNEYRTKIRDLVKASEDFVISDYKDIANTEFDGGEEFNFAVMVNRIGEVEAIVIAGEGIDNLRDADANESIIVTGIGRRGDDFDIKYHSYQAGEETGKDIRGKDVDKLKEGDLRLISINRRGRVTVLDPKEGTDFYESVGNGVVDEISREKDIITISGDKYRIAHDAIVYRDGRDLKEVEYTTLEEGDKVGFIATKAGVIEALVIDYEEEGFKPEIDTKVAYEITDAVETRDGELLVFLKNTETDKEISIEAANRELFDKAVESKTQIVNIKVRNIKGETFLTDIEQVELTVDIEEAKVVEEENDKVTISGVKFNGLAKGHKVTKVKVNDEEDLNVSYNKDVAVIEGVALADDNKYKIEITEVKAGDDVVEYKLIKNEEELQAPKKVTSIKFGEQEVLSSGANDDAKIKKGTKVTEVTATVEGLEEVKINSIKFEAENDEEATNAGKELVDKLGIEDPIKVGEDGEVTIKLDSANVAATVGTFNFTIEIEGLEEPITFTVEVIDGETSVGG